MTEAEFLTTRVRYEIEASDSQVAWAACADPRGVLTIGATYEVERVEEHTWHTKLFLVGIDCGRGFNSVNFGPAEAPMTEPVAPPICADVDEYTCAECKGHNRCEIEMDAGFGDYGRDDPREDR